MESVFGGGLATRAGGVDTALARQGGRRPTRQAIQQRRSPGSLRVLFDGSAGPTHIAALGQFTADGDRTFSGERTLNIGVAVFQQTFTCKYEVRDNGIGTADCTIMPGGSEETFTAVFVDKAKQGEFISTTAGVVARGVFRKQ